MTNPINPYVETNENPFEFMKWIDSMNPLMKAIGNQWESIKLINSMNPLIRTMKMNENPRNKWIQWIINIKQLYYQNPWNIQYNNPIM